MKNAQIYHNSSNICSNLGHPVKKSQSLSLSLPFEPVEVLFLLNINNPTIPSLEFVVATENSRYRDVLMKYHSFREHA